MVLEEKPVKSFLLFFFTKFSLNSQVKESKGFSLIYFFICRVHFLNQEVLIDGHFSEHT